MERKKKRKEKKKRLSQNPAQPLLNSWPIGRMGDNECLLLSFSATWLWCNFSHSITSLIPRTIGIGYQHLNKCTLALYKAAMPLLGIRGILQMKARQCSGGYSLQQAYLQLWKSRTKVEVRQEGRRQGKPWQEWYSHRGYDINWLEPSRSKWQKIWLPVDLESRYMLITIH